MSSPPGPAGRPCASCGRPLVAHARFCEVCGTSTDQGGGAHRAPDRQSYAPGQSYDPDPGYGPPARSAATPGPPPGYPPPPTRPSEQFLTAARGAAGDPLVGAATPNQTYLGLRLSYTDAGTNFDPLNNPEYQRALVGQFMAAVSAWVIGSVALFLVFGLAGIYQQISYSAGSFYGEGSGTSPVFVVWVLLSNVWSLGLACLFWLRKLPVQMTEWMLTVDGQAGSARPALDHMYAIIAARQTPVRSLRVIQVNRSGRGVRDYLQVDDQLFTGFVSSFGYGADLFIGWTFWLNLSPGRWLWLHFLRLVKGNGQGIYGSLVYDEPKALREVLHSAVRQGVDMATGEVRPAGQGAIGFTVPITNVSG